MYDVYRVGKITSDVDIGNWNNQKVYTTKDVVSHYATKHNGYTQKQFSFIPKVLKEADLIYENHKNELVMIKYFNTDKKNKDNFIEVIVQVRDEHHMFHYGIRKKDFIVKQKNKIVKIF